MDQLLQLSDKGAKVSEQARNMLRQVVEVTGTAQKLCTIESAPAELCRSTADTFGCLARLAVEAADSVVAAALAVGEAQLRVDRLCAGLEALAQREPAQRCAAEDEDAASDASGDSEVSGASASAVSWRDRHRLLLSLNSEVLQLQRELRGLVAASPALLEPVDVAQKEHIFSLAAEVLDRVEVDVNRAWYTSGAEGGQCCVEAMRRSLGVVFAATGGNVAMPSFESRILRLAGLLDVAQLSQSLEQRFSRYADLARGLPGEAELRRHLAGALTELHTPFVAAMAGA